MSGTNPNEVLTDAAEYVASVSRRITVLAAAANKAGLLPPPAKPVPDRLDQHVRHHAGYMRRNPDVAPKVERAVAIFTQMGKDLARLEVAIEQCDVEEALVDTVRRGHRALAALPEAFTDHPQLRELVTPKPPDQVELAPTAAPAPTPRGMPLAGFSARSPQRPPQMSREAMAENQALLDQGLARLRPLEVKILMARAAMGWLQGSSAGLAVLAPASRDPAMQLANHLRGDADAMQALQELVEKYGLARRQFERRPLLAIAARPALADLEAAFSVCFAFPVLEGWLAS